jgi:lipid-binding SYLF domain-containing protein
MRNTAFALFLLMMGLSVVAYAGDSANRVSEDKTVIEEIMAAPDNGIPRDLLNNAHCVVVVPAVKRGGFIVGAQYGKGIATCRQPQGTGWTGPSTVRMEGGSVGLQIGGGEMDVVMMVMNRTGAEKLMRSEFTIGGEGAAMAGPVGRSATAETDAYMHAEILSYSRTRGIFAGLVLKGTTLRTDDDDNTALYGRAIRHEDILMGRVPAPAVANPFLVMLNNYSSVEDKPADTTKSKKNN